MILSLADMLYLQFHLNGIGAMVLEPQHYSNFHVTKPYMVSIYLTLTSMFHAVIKFQTPSPYFRGPDFNVNILWWLYLQIAIFIYAPDTQQDAVFYISGKRLEALMWALILWEVSVADLAYQLKCHSTSFKDDSRREWHPCNLFTKVKDERIKDNTDV